MNAMPTKRKPQTIERSRRSRSPQRQIFLRGSIAAETILKLIFSSVVCIASATAIFRLLPYHILQESKLHEVKTEVRETKQRVDRLTRDLSRNTDIQQAGNLRQQYSHKVAPDRRPIIWLDGDKTSTIEKQESKDRQSKY